MVNFFFGGGELDEQQGLDKYSMASNQNFGNHSKRSASGTDG